MQTTLNNVSELSRGVSVPTKQITRPLPVTSQLCVSQKTIILKINGMSLPVMFSQARTIISELSSQMTSGESVFEVVATHVCSFYNVTKTALLSRSRLEHIAWARQVAMFLVHQLTDLTSVRIGQLFARDHGTVLHALHRVRGRIETEPTNAAIQVANIKAMVEATLES